MKLSHYLLGYCSSNFLLLPLEGQKGYAVHKSSRYSSFLGQENICKKSPTFIPLYVDQDKYVPSPASRGEDIYVPSAAAIFYFPIGGHEIYSIL
jgi:hypothetical protein